jgi:hypothetical protein
MRLQLVISEISESAALALLAVKLFAEYKSKAKSKVLIWPLGMRTFLNTRM